MARDIKMGWKSPVPVGSFVVISYGEPSSEDYEKYLDIDLNADGHNHNSTLWQKIYDEEQNEHNGIGYRLIMSMAGFTPRIQFTDPAIIEINADEVPYLDYDMSNIDKPKITLYLPQEQNVWVNEPNILNANELPNIIYDYGALDEDNQIIKEDSVPKAGEYGGTINDPVIVFELPQPQVLTVAQIERILDADEMPTLIYDYGELDEEGNPLKDENGNLKPGTFGGTINSPVLRFELPQSQVMQDPDTTVIAPDEDPSVVLHYKEREVDGKKEDDINKPFLEFKLPRAIKFYYGDLFGSKKDYIDETNDKFSDYAVGDYYINEATGFIYKVIKKEGTICSFEYIACIQQPLPEIGYKGISPYTKEKEQNIPKVTKELTNEDGTSWKLNFELPKAPIPAIESEFIGPLQTEEAKVEITNENTMTFKFKIPTGSKILMGTEVEKTGSKVDVEGARPGDVYVNSNSGDIFILYPDEDGNNGEWIFQSASFKGAPGDALHIVRRYRTTEPNTFLNGVNLIKERYRYEDGQEIKVESDDLFAVTFINEEENTLIAYWYFYTEDEKWGRVPLTGDILNFILNEYTPSTKEDPVVDMTYSVDYINSLIGGKIDWDIAHRVAFSKDQIYHLLSWGDWEDAKNPEDIPEGEDHDTLSVEEVIDLLSWHGFSSLLV